jgi:hypothetical protein
VKRILHPENVASWGYFDQLLGKGFTGTREHIAMQVQDAYLKAGINFHEKEIPAKIEDYMCSQGLASPCGQRTEGLGDLIHSGLLPFVRVVDKVFATNLEGCKGCKERQEALNKWAPL